MMVSIRATVAVLAACLLVGCATRPATRTIYKETKVTVPVSCVPSSLSPRPQGLKTAAQILAIPEGPRRYVALAQDWLARVERMNDTEPVIRACQTSAPAP